MTLGNVKKRSSGKIMIEFLLIAPVFLMISGGTIEVANFMRLSQISTVASQEMANTAYRRCTPITRVVNPNSGGYDPRQTNIQLHGDETIAAIQTCLDTIQQETLTRLQSLNSGSTDGNSAHLTVARFNSIDQSFQVVTAEDPPSTSTPAGQSTNSSDGSTRNPKTNQYTRNSDDSKGKDRSDQSNNGGKHNGNDKPKSVAWTKQVHISGRSVTYQARGQTVTLIDQQQLQTRQQVVVGQVVAEYTPLIKFFNLSILYSGEFRATTLL